MKNMKFWRTALVATLVLTIMLSVTGGTIAWFTDSVTSESNIIKSGTLDVEMYWANGKDAVPTEDAGWTDASKGTIFNHTLWEPGYTEVRHVKIENKGTLALKYVLEIQPTGEVSALADVIDVYYVDPAVQVADRAALANVPALSTLADFIAINGEIETNTAAGHLAAGEAHTVTLALKMQESAGNEYQDLSIGSDFKLVLRATQDTVEKDSFDDQYDTDAVYPGQWDGTVDTSWYNTTDKSFKLTTPAQLAGLSALSAKGNTFSGKTVELGADIDLANKVWTPIKQFSGTLDGGNYTVSSFIIDGTNGRAGFINTLGQYPATVKNLNLSDVVVKAGSSYTGILVANGHTAILNNIHISDVQVETVNKDAWFGGFYGYFNWTSASNCTMENVEVNATKGAKFIGGFSGNMDQDLAIDNVDIKGFKVTVSDTDNDCAVGGFTGQTQTGHRQPTFNNCDVTDLEIVASGTVDVGGFVGDPGAHTIANNCTVSGTIDATNVTSASQNIGGFFADAGWNNNESSKGGHKLTNCSADVDIVTGGAAAGGFIGSCTNDNNRNMPIAFASCSATGEITVAAGATANIGGFAGEADRGTYKNCSTTSDTFIGKLIDGYVLNDDGNGTLTVTKSN